MVGGHHLTIYETLYGDHPSTTALKGYLIERHRGFGLIFEAPLDLKHGAFLDTELMRKELVKKLLCLAALHTGKKP